MCIFHCVGLWSKTFKKPSPTQKSIHQEREMVKKKGGGITLRPTCTQNFEKTIVSTLANIHYYVFCQVGGKQEEQQPSMYISMESEVESILEIKSCLIHIQHCQVNTGRGE
ncbi:UNVERIFIED_CONTAM: hypothetical protein K2H54_029352 [Gekko kuhli]